MAIWVWAPAAGLALLAMGGGRHQVLGREAATMTGITLTLDRTTLNPVREPGRTAALTLTAQYADGISRRLPLSDAKLQVRTVAASGGVAVARLVRGRVAPLEGGVAEVEAEVARSGRTFRASARLVVRPFYRDYHQTLVLKLFMGMEGKPVERLVSDPMFQKPNDVLCTFEQALEVIRKTDRLTRGMPKIIYLVGWQKGGHDHGYPSWDEVNPRLKRTEDATALESLRWLIRAARRYHTTVSLHLNMLDAYRQSPLFEEYAARDLFAREADGRLLVAGIQMQGEEMYNVVYPREWEAGLAQRRIDLLIKRVPELAAGHTIHVDVFIAQRAEYDRFRSGDPVSPWHAKPENGGLTPDRYVETQRKIFHYWREQGFDVTGEGIFWAHPPGEGFTGLQSMSWWYPGDPGYQMLIPERLMARGRTDRGSDGDFRFGSSMHGEEIFKEDLQRLPGFLGMFSRATLPWAYLSRLERERLDGETLHYSGGVTAGVESGRRIIRKGDFILRDDDDLFVPAVWKQREIIAYSRKGYAERTWRLPDEWAGVAAVDVQPITLEGQAPVRRGVPVRDGQVCLTLAPEGAVAIVPAGAR
jgi:hypothetical protein